MRKYEIILYWSSEDDAFIAEVPELPGCAADGATRQEALANVEVVIAEWLETTRELGRSIPEPKGRLLFAYAECRPPARMYTDSRSGWGTGKNPFGRCSRKFAAAESTPRWAVWEDGDAGAASPRMRHCASPGSSAPALNLESLYDLRTAERPGAGSSG